MTSQHSRAGDGSGSSAPPPVPSIMRRSSSLQRDDEGRMDNNQQQTMGRRATDEFGFPVTQQLRSSSPQPPSQMTHKIDLEKVSRPSRLQHQRGNSTQQLHPMPSMTRNNSASSSKVSTSSSRPPRSQNATLSRQISNQSTSSSTRRPKKGPRIKVSRPDPSKYKHYTFQHPAHAMRVSVRTVDLSHRIAFDTRIPPGASSASLRRMLDEMDRVRGSRSTSGSVIEDGKKRAGENPCRISPSPNHMALLEFMHGSRGVQSLMGRDGKRVVRQLQWNPACGVDADPWFDGRYEEDARDAASLDGSGSDRGGRHGRSRPMRRKPKSVHGDGRYIPIDPLEATRKSLPNHSPILTNLKRRLPMRSDVGFANPSPEEVSKKMEEVKKEAEWEEASPRVVLLASGFSLFREEEEMDELHPSCRTDAEMWAGGSIPGVPFAGRDLVAAYKVTARVENGNGAEGQTQSADTDRGVGLRAFSSFAPPVDSTFSSTQLWRPRPFMDRPPGFVYFLACPLDVRFEAGDSEPFFCTMALYSLPKSSEKGDGSRKAHHFCGKISEDFFFPAGDWNAMEGSFDEGDEQPQAWRKRKRRAIMSYDPVEVSPKDLHLVIQVFRASVPGDSDTINGSAIPRKKSFRNKIKGSLLPDALKAKSRSREQNDEAIGSFRPMPSSSESNEGLANTRTSFEEVGAQYLSPVCFSITPAFHAGSTQQKQESASFYCFPETPESHEDFVTRLVSLANPLHSGTGTKPIPMGGYADVLTSYLGMDFTRALLDEPPQLYNALDDAAPIGPQLLADVMGDCAISFDGDGAKKQRSKLRRLAPSRDAGYSSSFDLKEVLYLPPRSLTRKYEDDTSLCSTTLLNLLYLYPRLIRWSSSRMDDKSQMSGSEQLSLRIQVVEQELRPGDSFDGSDPTYQALQSVYNPTSPAGPPLTESFFTKVVKRHRGHQGDRQTKAGRKEIPLIDEVKLRLPDILDRRHFLRFTLFSIRSDADAEMVAETTIPFIISSKESCSGGRVTTIIPNGLHRIQLCEGLQVHVESRLASSSHVSDPSVATLLRDFPSLSDGTKSSAAGGDMDSSTSSSDIANVSSGFPFLDILTMASGQAVKRHFSSLTTGAMLNLVNQRCPSFYFEPLHRSERLVALEKTEHLLAIVRSLFEILDKTRTSYQEREHSMLSVQYHRLIKSFLDSFDEHLFAHQKADGETHDLEHADSGSERHLNDSLASSQDFQDDSFYDEPSSALSDPKDAKRTRIPKYQIKSPRNNNLNPRSFSRRAFVATKNDLLKAEAELNADDTYRREYFDDDETVATLGTVTSGMDAGSVFPLILESRSYETIQKTNTMPGIEEEPSAGWTCGSEIVNTPPKPKRSSPQTGSSTPFSFASKRAEYMANRVNNMAQLVMAPCIAPSVDGIISGGDDIIQGDARSGSSSYRKRGTGNQSPFEPSSDVEEEGDAKITTPYLRGNQSCLKISPLLFQPLINADDSSANGELLQKPDTAHLYEVFVCIWVQAWTSSAASTNSDSSIQGSSNVIPTWPYELVQGSHNPTSDAAVSFSFIRHVSFFLPLCLKSIGLRCAQNNTTKLIVPMTLFDDHHMQVLVLFVETIALGLMREGMSGGSGAANSDQMLAKALSANDCVLDFFIGLFALVHPSQVAALLFAYFNIIEGIEDPAGSDGTTPAYVSKSHLRRSKCSRQLRLHAVERLAAMPCFARLNFPLKFTGSYPRRKVAPSSWSKQRINDHSKEDSLQKFWEKVDRIPRAYWLSELLMNQCLSICNGSCEMIIMEAKRQAKATKNGRRVQNSMLRDDLLRVESLAFHSILCAYELLIKRQAMDSRFQSISSATRVAALFTRPVLQQSVTAATRLARMDSDQKVRLIWVLCLLYILQEGPDALIRDELRRFCDPEDNRIHHFVHVLKLASSTCQHFIPGVDSLPVLGGLSKEMTQEAFNTLSASAILLVDECFEVVSEDGYELEKLGKSVFDLLLHLLSTPQSSVTLLRTLGGSAHALDKFGPVIFMKAVGDQLQHWGRIILTMMNSTELSVRSMAVDFLVSMIGAIHQEFGSIDLISLSILSVLPEVVAREIALCSLSGLVKSMEDVESSLWPLRRALADVEETNPLDDDRVDPQLLPSLSLLCRTGQAIIDGVLVEMRLRGTTNLDLDAIAKAQRVNPASGFLPLQNLSPKTVFDADEESILEAATFFSCEASIPQKLRWLFTLRDLHAAKRQWSEAAESLMICAQSLIGCVDHLSNLWQPSRFDLWADSQHSPWLSSIGSPGGQHGLDNMAVMDFASAFLECGVFAQEKRLVPNMHVSVEAVCSLLTSVVDQMAVAYSKEDGMQDIAFSHFEELLNLITIKISDESRRYPMEARTAFRRVRANICTRLAQFSAYDVGRSLPNRVRDKDQVYVRVILHGNKPKRFKESTTIPTYFEWEAPSICRVTKPVLMAAARMRDQNQAESWDECVCRAFAMPLLEALRIDEPNDSVILRTKSTPTDETKTNVSVIVVQKTSSNKTRKFFTRVGQESVVYSVTHKFPHSLSRQRQLISEMH